MFLTALTLLALAVNPAHAACDAKALTAALTDGSPQAAPGNFVALAACDPAAAKKAAAAAVPRFISGDDASAAAIAALKVGASAEVVAWVNGQQPDERGQTIHTLGEACGSTKEVQAFFLSQATAMGDAFWNERWYRGLATCRVPEVQTLLGGRIATMQKGEKTSFLGVLEVYARNLGPSAIPKLAEMAAATRDVEVQTYIINAMSDAVGVGAASGPDAKAAEQAVAAIVALAPNLGQKALVQARTTVRALGDERVSDELAAVYFKDLKQADNSLLWGVIAVETATCKNGKVQQNTHVAELRDAGHTWPDQIKERATAATGAWTLNLAEKCKGEGKVEILVPAEPVADAAALKTWTEAQLKEIQKTAVDKRSRVDHDALKL